MLDKVIRSVVRTTQSPLFSIPGIGPTLEAMILAEIGDIHRFSSPNKLQALAGLEPSHHDYLLSKQAQGKHYYVALGHTAKKLIRVIFHILNANEVFVPQA